MVVPSPLIKSSPVMPLTKQDNTNYFLFNTMQALNHWFGVDAENVLDFNKQVDLGKNNAKMIDFLNDETVPFDLREVSASYIFLDHYQNTKDYCFPWLLSNTGGLFLARTVKNAEPYWRENWVESLAENPSLFTTDQTEARAQSISESISLPPRISTHRPTNEILTIELIIMRSNISPETLITLIDIIVANRPEELDDDLFRRLFKLSIKAEKQNPVFTDLTKRLLIPIRESLQIPEDMPKEWINELL